MGIRRAVSAMRTADVMTRPVLTVRADDSIEQAAALLAGNATTAAPVLDAEGDLIGIVSEGDLLRVRMAREPDATRQGPAQRHAVIVADVMTRNVVVMTPDADLTDIAKAMLHHAVHSVPIVSDAGQVVGIISRLDLLRAYVRADDVVQLDVQRRLDEYAGSARVWSVTVCDGVAEIAGRYTDEVERIVVEVLARTVPGVERVRAHG
jgi:CBS domain-containing protein